MNQPDPYHPPAETTDTPPNVSDVPKPERQWAMFSHLSSFSGLLVPLGSILGPLIMFLIKKDEFRFGGDQAKEALNFNISCGIYALICLVLCFVFIGFVLLPALVVYWFVFTIIATVKANDGVPYRYPLCIRLVN